MLGLSIIFAFYGLGVGLEKMLNLPIPGNVIGLILFAIALFTKWIPINWVELPAKWLNQNMLLFFTPYVVGSMTFFSLMAMNALSIGISMVVSTGVVLVVTGWVTSKLEKHQPVRCEKR